MRKKLILLIKILLLLFIVYIPTRSILLGNILFHTDIARDFLLMNEMREKIQLIGAAVRGQTGLFHGSLWLYVNLPVFFIGHGDPVIVGVFWIILLMLTLGIIYWVTSKLFDKTTAYFSSVFFGLTFSSQFDKLYNPHGALIIYPLFFLFLVKYLQQRKAIYLSITFLLTGIITQLHLGFGLTTFLITIILVFIDIIRSKKYLHLATSFIYLIPLIPFFLFDLRHNFIQLNAIINIVNGHGNDNSVYSGLLSLLSVRIEDFFMILFAPLTNHVLSYTLIILGLICLCLKRTTNNHRIIYSLFFILFFSYFVIFFPYSSIIPNYYIWSIYPIILIVFASVRHYLDKSIVQIIFLSIIASSIITFLLAPRVSSSSLVENAGNWLYYKNFARNIIRNIPDPSFGYYTMSRDQYGYSMNYGIVYESKKLLKQAFYNKKLEYTVVIIAASNNDQHAMDPKWYINKKVNMNYQKPLKMIRAPDGAYALIYQLTKGQQSIPSAEDINIGLNFR